MQIECDNCDRTFEIDPTESGPKVACPFCGDINRVSRPEAPTAQPEPEAEPEPTREETKPADSLPSGEAPEKEIVVVRPAMFRAHPLRFLIILVLVLLGGVLAIGGGFEISGWKPILMWLGLPLLLAGLIWYAGWWISVHLWIKLRISNKRSIRHVGIVQRHTTEVLHNHVRSVDIEQTLLQRIFNVGTIGIDSAGQDDIEIICKDIPNPYHVKQLIDKYRKM